MQLRNQFSICIKEQELKVSSLLNAIKNGEQLDLHASEKHLSSLIKTNPKAVTLQDLQLAIARDLRTTDWTALQAHAKQLDYHRKAISSRASALDEDMKTLHIRCGHDLCETIPQAGFEGEYLAMIDPLCMGPIPSNNKDFIDIRSQYISETLLPLMESNKTKHDITSDESNAIKTLQSHRYERLVFWLEHDCYDQFMLLRALSLLLPDTLLPKDCQTIELIEVSNYPGETRFIGLGQLPPEAIRACWQYRKPITSELISEANQAWRALQCHTPERLMSLLESYAPTNLPSLPKALKRHLQELPHIKTGLSKTQFNALSVLKEQQKPITVEQWFRLYQNRETLPFLGDIMFFASVLPLSRTEDPLFNIHLSSKLTDSVSKKVTISTNGLACLAGKRPFENEYWVGGIKLSKDQRWTWDHQNLKNIRSIPNLSRHEKD